MTGLVLGLGLGAISLQAAPMAVPTDVFVLGGQSNGTDLAPWDSGADWPSGSYQLERWTLPRVTDMPGSGATEIAPAAAQIIAAARPLAFYAYSVPQGLPGTVETQSQALQWLAQLHAVQLAACSYGEFDTAFRRVHERMAQQRSEQVIRIQPVSTGKVA